MLSESERIRLEELLLELLETTTLATQKVIDFADRNNITFPERKTLGHLLTRAGSTIHELHQFRR